MKREVDSKDTHIRDLHQIHVAEYKYPIRATCIRLYIYVNGYKRRRIQVLSSVLLADTSGYI